MKVAICVTTYKRPIMLNACLNSIVNVISPENTSIEVIIINNDIASKNINIASKNHKDSPYKIHYIVEPKLGIPYARNSALTAAEKFNFDWVAFIDDDEIADPNWLSELFKVQKLCNAHIVQGKVIYDFPKDDKWARFSKFNTNGKKRANCAILNSAATNNVLISSNIFSNSGLALRFDESMQFTGGSDTDFFNRARAKNIAIYYANDAVVYETVPTERCTLKWLYLREKRTSAAAVYIDKKSIGTKSANKKHLIRILNTILQVTISGIIFPIQLLLNYKNSNKNFMHLYLKIANAHGRISGLCGKLSTPYKKIEGH